MSRLLRAELLKIRTTRLWWALLLAAVGLVALQVALGTLLAGQQGTPGLESDRAVRNIWGGAGNAGILAMILGIIVLAGEYRHMTMTSTALVTPRRGRVVAAKLGAAALVGLVYGLVACVVTAAIAVPLLSAKGATGHAEVVPILGGAILATVLYAIVGVGVGALVRNQVAAVVGALIWVLVVEALVVVFLPEVGRWLPGGAANAILQASTPNGGLLPAWGGALLFCGYGLLFALLGARFAVRRDIT